MKKFIVALTGLFLTASLYAQVPKVIQNQHPQNDSKITTTDASKNYASVSYSLNKPTKEDLHVLMVGMKEYAKAPTEASIQKVIKIMNDLKTKYGPNAIKDLMLLNPCQGRCYSNLDACLQLCDTFGLGQPCKDQCFIGYAGCMIGCLAQ